MIGDLRKSLDTIGKLAGMDLGEVRTRRFRHTYCSTRLETVQRILEPGTKDEWDYVPVERFTVQKEMGHGGAQLVDRIYGHVQRNHYRAEVVEYRLRSTGRSWGHGPQPCWGTSRVKDNRESGPVGCVETAERKGTLT